MVERWESSKMVKSRGRFNRKRHRQGNMPGIKENGVFIKTVD